MFKWFTALRNTIQIWIDKIWMERQLQRHESIISDSIWLTRCKMNALIHLSLTLELMISFAFPTLDISSNFMNEFKLLAVLFDRMGSLYCGPTTVSLWLIIQQQTTLYRISNHKILNEKHRSVWANWHRHKQKITFQRVFAGDTVEFPRNSRQIQHSIHWMRNRHRIRGGLCRKSMNEFVYANPLNQRFWCSFHS